MKFKHVIGLDVGTNSLGWCLLKEFEDSAIEIIKTGVHIFPIGTIVDDKSNKEKTRNEQRRQYRGASRMRYRFKLRRKNLRKILNDLGMLPDYNSLIKPFKKGKKKEIPNYKRGQSFNLYKLRADAIDSNIQLPLQDIGKIFMLLNKYRGFKTNSKNKKDDKETGIVKKGINELKGFMEKNNARTIGEYFFIMHQKAKELYNNNKWHNFNEPLDERAFLNDNEIVLFNSNGIRRHNGRATSRDMYTDEFDKIWFAQKKFYPEKFTGSKEEYDEIAKLPYVERIVALKEFKKTNYWHIKEYCIYYQRPLKSQKKFVSNCQFERGVYDVQEKVITENGIEKNIQKRVWKKKAKKASPQSHPYFQEFKVWQKLHQIKYSSVLDNVFKQPLLKEWIAVLGTYLNTNKEIQLTKPSKNKRDMFWLGKLLEQENLIQNADTYNFFIDETDEDVEGDDKNINKISGNITYANFREALGDEKFNELLNATINREENINNSKKVITQESKLLMLWHHLYIAKDGLFKENEWLHCVLTEKTKWNLDIEQAERLIELPLVSDYGSYSLKVIKSILPFMRAGFNEYESLKMANKGYINEDNTVGQQIQLKEKISQLKYQELRNPVVERALSKAIKLVNAILEKYKTEIVRENFEIRIESTRQFKKPRQERENERRKNVEKDKLRTEYAAYLTKRKNEIGFTKDIYKNSSIVSKYELWLQMNMNEEDEIFVNEFKAFSKITKQDDRLKHKLWLECGRKCPYTGTVINFTDCFSERVEIEHIIPLSRSLDDSFNNKTLTYRETNADKGNKTPIEYFNRISDDALKTFKERITRGNNDFSDSKKELFLAEKINAEFSHDQISNTSYIASYARNKMKEVCRNVQFTNGSATAELRNKDWGLSNLLDKIRYEEDLGKNVDEIFLNYYRIRKDYRNWYFKKHNSNDFSDKVIFEDNNQIEKYIKETNNDLIYWQTEKEQFEQFRNKDGKKDRSDHRHHAVDAFVIGCCSPQIIKTLSTYNAQKEIQHLQQRDWIDKNFDYEQLKKITSEILVSHSEKQSLIKKRKNRIKTKNGVVEHITYAPQGKLHEESFYAKRNGATVRRVQLFNEDSTDKKILYEKASDLDYSVKGVVKWHYIDDDELYQITKSRLENFAKKAFTKEQMIASPFYRVSPNSLEKITSKKEKPLPIVKSIRKRFNTDRTLINLPAKDENKNILTSNRYTDNDSNAVMILYENIIRDKKGNTKKPERDFELLSFYKSIGLKNPNNMTFYKDGKLFFDEKNDIGFNSECRWLQNGDLIALFIDEKDKEALEWDNNEIMKNRLFIVKGLSSSIVTTNEKEYEFGYVSLLKTKAAKPKSYSSEKDIADCIKLNSFKLSHIKLNAIKIRLNILGEIEAKGEECF